MSALSKTDLNVRLSAMLKRTLPFVFEALEHHEAVAHSSRLFPGRAAAARPAGHRGRGVLSADAVPLTLDGTEFAPLAAGRPVVSARYSHDRRQLLVAYGGAAPEGGAPEARPGLTGDGFIVLWELASEDQSGRPAIAGVLICQCAVSCACWGPQGTKTVCAGLANGAVAVWDLADTRSTSAAAHGAADGGEGPFRSRVWRESATSEYQVDVGARGRGVGRKVDITCPADLDASRRQALADVSPNGHPGGAAISSPSSSFAVVSTDEFLQIQVCSVSLLWNLDTVKAPLEGTRIGARVKIINVTDEVHLGARGTAPASSSGLATCIQTVPGQSVQFVLGSTGGALLRGARFGVPPAPRVWKPDLSETSTHDFDDAEPAPGARGAHSGAGVAQVAFSPFLPDVMAVAYDTGQVAIFSLGASQQMLLISEYVGLGPRGIQWSPSCPSVLLVLDTSSTVHRHDVLDHHITSVEEGFDAVMTASEPVRSPGGAAAVAIAVPPAVLPASMGSGGRADDDWERTVAVTYDDGSVRVMLLEETPSEPLESAVARLRSVLEREQF